MLQSIPAAPVLRARTILDLLKQNGMVTLAVLMTAGGMGHPASSGRRAAFQTFPRVILWAWENPEDLRGLDPKRCGIAYLDQSIFISPEVSTRPRFQRLLVPTGAKIMAVVRIQAAPGADVGDPSLPETVANLVERSARKPGVSALQIDFDATQSQRVFYAKLVEEVRKKLPDQMPLSITALASWCAADDWIGALPVDEAVPMFFRMGRDVRPSNEAGWTYPIREPLCKTSMGVSMDEPWPAFGEGERVYVFHPRAWNAIALGNLEAMVKP